MGIKTSKSYQRAVLACYKKHKGGEMSNYLANPTRKKIREACLWLLDRRKENGDESILNQFFQFKVGEERRNHIRGLKSEKADKFMPVINFLKGNTQDTGYENLELISWLIDFKPRPLQAYLQSEKEPCCPSDEKIIAGETSPKPPSGHLPVRTWPQWIKGGLGVMLLCILIIFGQKQWNKGVQGTQPSNSNCMTWVDVSYVQVSCHSLPNSEKPNQVIPLDPLLLKNFKKVEVNAAYNFFTEDGKPLVWYYKNKQNEIEYYTAPGLHPITGKTLDEITEYIIDKYVPIHIDQKDSLQEDDEVETSLGRPEKDIKSSNNEAKMLILIFDQVLLDHDVIQQLLQTKFVTYAPIQNPFSEKTMHKYRKDLLSGNISSIYKYIEHKIDYLVIGNVDYDFRKTSSFGNLIICDLAINYQTYSVEQGDILIKASMSNVVTGSGFSETLARQNAILKIGTPNFNL